MTPFHLHHTNPVTRFQVTTRLYALSEENMPKGSGLPGDLLDIVNFLDPDNSPRYERTSRLSALYAYDFCYLAGAYLPNLWWHDPYNQNPNNFIRVSAAGLYHWLTDFGKDFGWKEVLTTKEAQELADVGNLVVITGSPKDIHGLGKISIVLPGNSISSNHKSIPLQSMAGKKFLQTDWYKGEKMREYKIYVNFLK